MFEIFALFSMQTAESDDKTQHHRYLTSSMNTNVKDNWKPPQRRKIEIRKKLE